MTPDGRHTRRRFLRTSAAGLGGAVLLGSGGAIARSGRGADLAARPPIRKPGVPLNLVVVNLDTVRADHVGCYAQDATRPARAARTPSIDALAKDALRFRHVRPESLPTGPTRRSFYTGIRTFPMDAWKPEDDSPHIYGWQRIPAGQTTIQEVLGAAGYATAMVTDNTWLLKPSWKRFRNTFGTWRGIEGQEHQRLRGGVRTKRIELADHVTRELRRSDDKRVRAHLKVVETYLRNASGREREEDWWAPQVFRGAIDWLETHTKTAPTQPFALFVESYDPHEPWDPPKKYVDLYDDPGYRGLEPIQPFYGGADYLTRRQQQRMRALYRAELTMADKWFGTLLERLDDLRLLERTVVVFWSDHGISLAERGYVGKNPSQVYAEMVDVPLLIRHPEGRRAGDVTDYLAQCHDIAPTALAMLGFAAPEASEGHDLAPLFHGEEPQERKVQTAGYNDYVWAGDERWSYIDSNRFTDPKLYDRTKDPRERRDVSSASSATVQRMRRALRADAGDRPIPRYR